LTSLNIAVLPHSLEALLGVGQQFELMPASGLATTVAESCAVITEQSVAADPWVPPADASGVGHVLLKYLRLIVGTEKMGLESVVDDFVIHLFAALGFNSGKLLILSKNKLTFTMNKSTCEATADVTVYDVSHKFRLAVVEDKKDPVKASAGDLADNEAQLVAEAIAAAQANLNLRHLEAVKRPRSQSEGGTVGPASPPPEQSPMFMLRVVGDSFSFYSTQLSSQFLNEFADYEKMDVEKLAVTPVYKLSIEVPQAAASPGAAVPIKDRWQFKVPHDRATIIQVLDQIRQIIE